MLSLFAGTLAGLLHILSGPDHVLTLAPFSVEARGEAWRVGIRWGLGHAVGVLLVAIPAFFVRDIVDFDGLLGLGEQLIGWILIGVGSWGLAHLRNLSFDRADLAGDEVRPAHLHTTAALLVGGAHGTLGTGHILGVLPVLALPSWVDAVTYLAGFACGTILAMTGVAALIGLVVRRGGAQAARIYRGLFATLCLAALLAGVAWIGLPLLGYEIPR